MLDDCRYRLRALFRRSTLDAELDAEVRDHLEREAAKYVARGLTPADARRRARLAFGGVDVAKEASRDARGVSFIDMTAQDVRYAMRVLRRAPMFTGLAVLSLGLGIGANSAVFSVVNAVLLKPLRVRDPATVVRIELDPRIGWDYPAFRYFHDSPGPFSGVAGVFALERANIGVGGAETESAPASVHLVSGDYFTVFGVHAAIGRTIGPDDDRVPDGHAVAVISDGYWRRRFGSASDVIGRTVSLHETKYTVIGVAAHAFTGDVVGEPADLWIPMTMQSEVMPERPNLLTNPNPPWVRIIARLAPGVTQRSAAAGATRVFQQLVRERAEAGLRRATLKEIAESAVDVVSEARGFSNVRASITRPIVVVWGIVALVLLVACANVAGLLFARSAAREREIATRLALGASTGRVARQLLTEGMLLSAGGTVVGVVVAYSGVGLLQRVADSGLTPMHFVTTPDARVFAMTAGVCIVVGVLCGLAPALGARRLSLVSPLKTSAGGALRTGGRRFGLGRLLVVGQVALSLAVIVAAGLFMRTLTKLDGQDMGFDRAHVLLAWTAAGDAGITRARLADVTDAVIARVAVLPGVRTASASNRGLFGTTESMSPVSVPGYVRRAADEVFVRWNLVAPRFFDASGIALAAGRDFGPSDVTGGPRVAIVSESMARHYFGDMNAVGKHFGMRRDTDYPIEIIGVARDAKYSSPREAGVDMIYLPARQDLAHYDDLCLIVRTVGAPVGLAQSIRRTIRGVDSALPVRSVESADGQVSRTLMQERLIAGLSGFFGAVALLLAALGLYAIVAHSVVTRTAELGIRLALGGTERDVLALILRESLGLVAIGLVLGVGVAVLVARAVASQLFGIDALDPVSMIAATLAMTVTGLLAAAIPAFRATRIDPSEALRRA